MFKWMTERWSLSWIDQYQIRYLKSVHFLGLANYYRQFICGYSRKIVALTYLLKKDKAWAWITECHNALDMLKRVVASEPVLRLPNFALWTVYGCVKQSYKRCANTRRTSSFIRNPKVEWPWTTISSSWERDGCSSTLSQWVEALSIGYKVHRGDK